MEGNERNTDRVTGSVKGREKGTVEIQTGTTKNSIATPITLRVIVN
jgi:hypothetical protein